MNLRQTKTVAWLTAHRYDQGGGCLIWPFARLNGYGTFGQKVGGKMIMFYAHRVMCEMVYGPPPSPDYEAGHECGNGIGGCCHPQHVKWKTKSDNQRDRRRHGTKSTGPVGKLNDGAVAQIRALRGKLLQRELAELFGCSRANISLIQLGKLWPEIRTRRRAVPRNPGI